MTEAEFEIHLRAIIDGDKEGLHHIYRAYGAYIYAIVYDVIKNKEDAEDITAEFFIKLWKIANKYTFGKRHRAWLGKIAHNMAIDYIRSKKEHVSYEEIVESEKIGQGSFEEQVISDISVKEVVESLECEEKEIVTLKVLGQLTFREIAEIIKRPMGTVTWKYKQAMEKLRRCRLS